MSDRPGFLGYRRPDGRIGTRNHVLVVPTVICSSVVAERVAAATQPIGTALPHLAGCGQLGPDMRVTHDTLAAYCGHPNVGAVVVIALGCEQVVAQSLAEAARRHGKPVEIVAIQSEGGTVRTTAKATAIAQRFAEALDGAAAGVVRRVRARALTQVRRVRLHVRAGVESDARPRHRSPRRSRRDGRARRDRRDHGRRAPAGVARDAARDRDQADSDHHARRDRSPRARPRHPRHAALARQHPRRADHHRREIARRDAQGRRSRAARGRRRLLRADHRRRA